MITTWKGEYLDLTKWLRKIPGIEIGQLKSKGSPYNSSFTFTIRKTGSEIHIPKLKLKSATFFKIIVREFEEVGDQ